LHLQIYDSKGPIDVSTDHIYEGEVIGDRNSYVFGSIHNGVFEGKIITERDAYYVEHAKHYFPTNRTAKTPPIPTTTSAPRSISTVKNTQPTRPLARNNNNSNNNRTAVDSKTENFIKKIAESTTTTQQLPEHSDTTSSSSTTFPPTTENSEDAKEHNAEDELDFHSIIYKESHVEDAYENVREGKSK